MAIIDINNSQSMLLVARTIKHQESLLSMKVLFDSDGSDTMIPTHCLPVGATTSLLPTQTKFQMVAGTLDSYRKVFLEDILPNELKNKKK